MSWRSQRRRALEEYYERHPPLPRHVRFVAPGMIRCVDCGHREALARALDTWRVFRHGDGEWDDYCPDCATRRLA